MTTPVSFAALKNTLPTNRVSFNYSQTTHTRENAHVLIKQQ